MRNFRTLCTVGLALAIVGCEDLTELNVQNNNNPDTERALANAEDVESLIAGSFLSWWSATQKSAPSMATTTMADEGTGSWGNWGMQDLSSEPRVAYNNSSTYRYSSTNNVPWFTLYGALSATYDGITAINNGLEIGDGGADNNRALAFGKFVQGLSHGFLALLFDQAFIFDETVDFDALAAGGTLDAQPYATVMAAAMTQFSDALALANNNTFTLESTWMNGNAYSSSEFAQVIRGYMARYMASVARTPAERAAVDWTAIRGHAQAAIGDINIQGDGSSWWERPKHHGQNHIWVRADYKTIGVMDTGGGYQNWLNTPVADRTWFDMLDGTGASSNPDLRIQNGVDADGDPAAGLYFGYYGSPLHRPDRGTYHFSSYMNDRFAAFHQAGAVGPMLTMTQVEMDLLVAESYLQAGNIASAYPIINQTRVNNGGLPALTGTESLQATFEALWYEQNIEEFHVAGSQAYFRKRGTQGLASGQGTHNWGHVTGSPLHFPIAGAELEILQLPNYTFGGAGNEMGPIGPGVTIAPVSMPAKQLYAFEIDMTAREKLEYIRTNFHERLDDPVVGLTRY